VNGYSYAAPPLELVPFIPGALVPVPAFMVAWGAICAASVFIIGRRLGWVWLLYPPLLHGAWLGNPAIPGMVAVMLGLPLLGLVLKPQLLFVGTRRAVAIFAVLSLLALLLRPDFLAAISSLVGRYGDQSAVVNAWMTPWMIPVGISLILLARRDRRAAAWLVMPAIGPAMGWYGYAMVLPVGSTWLSVACAIPVPGLGAGAIALYGITRYVGWSPSTIQRPDADEQPTRGVAGATAQRPRVRTNPTRSRPPTSRPRAPLARPFGSPRDGMACASAAEPARSAG
jgi:hypothetical protein